MWFGWLRPAGAGGAAGRGRHGFGRWGTAPEAALAGGRGKWVICDKIVYSLYETHLTHTRLPACLFLPERFDIFTRCALGRLRFYDIADPGKLEVDNRDRHYERRPCRDGLHPGDELY